MKRIQINRLGHHGDGIGDGPVYAPLTLPGEVIEAEGDDDRLSDIRIIEPSPDRVAPPCRHFKSCGGCQLQHASDDFLAAWKQDVVRVALSANDLTAEFLPIAVSPPRSRRRATFSARRTKKGAMAGFHMRGSDVIVEIPECQLLHPDLMRALPVAEMLACAGASRKHSLSVAATTSLNGLDISISGGKPLDGPLRLELAALAGQQDLARLSWEDEVIATRLPPEQRFDGVAVVPPAGAFLQATQEGEDALRQDVVAIVGTATKVADLFSGCGTFALPLARHAAVHAVEGEKAMIEALDRGWRKSEGLKAVTHEARDLFRRPLLPDELARFDAVVIDPPRAGAQAQVAELCAASVPTIAYVSCNPASFARDARTLVESGYQLDAVRVVDQFRWSAHVELVAAFRR
ncbi:23S rRNA m(5)U-1939 methyltransferase [Roseovarius halotolerans]|uniref:23S rRNA (Uracil(1939)-C(5))-methyltransferase RlmD n=1 Tax=Roseovarius halotolerans TaxID=505353 RepID=A0A1X6Z3X1_9RHOB|nr:class I SAM-dependent RNA methyltransferase [Roseovarius halotolerans]RKT32274.1 23S rRNA m(5)U-1939 methyltransferase [Roseovarius halotolerans]SLN39395.1 23S rRNA (uracil(1939)-C(5))-methyltransferase RlmD [Roseovarius halotolerans]